MGSSSNRHPIRVVARRTGTPETTLRAWERRYGVVRPSRAETGRRLYSDRDIERLQLVRRAVDAGRSVSSVAGLTDEALRRLVADDARSGAIMRSLRSSAVEGRGFVEECIRHVEAMDAIALESELHRALLKLTASAFIDRVIAPLLHRIGKMWHEGLMDPRHEHMATSVVRAVLSHSQAGVRHPGRHTIIVATPPGQMHDIGTYFVGAVALAEGWSVVNLGSDIAAPDIAAAADDVHADAIALSIVHPSDDPRVVEALTYLPEHLSPEVILMVGGQAARSYKQAANEAGATICESASDLARLLSKHGS